jgi:hypothetical protein
MILGLDRPILALQGASVPCTVPAVFLGLPSSGETQEETQAVL